MIDIYLSSKFFSMLSPSWASLV